jgi:hypothetical protein
MSSDVVLDIFVAELSGNVGSLTPVGMSSDVVLDIDIFVAELSGKVGSLAPIGMSSDVPTPVVALTRGKDTDISRNAAAGIRKIVAMTLAWKDEFRLTTTISVPNALNFTRK